MYAAEFDYHKADSVADALQLLGAHQGAKLIAGGHSLIPLLKLRLSRPAALVDIGGIDDLKGISVNDGTVHIGALATHAPGVGAAIGGKGIPGGDVAAAAVYYEGDGVGAEVLLHLLRP